MKQLGKVYVSDGTYGDVLQHFGILGMKWGVRRYQNADGTLTAAGKKRYQEGSKLGNTGLIPGDGNIFEGKINIPGISDGKISFYIEGNNVTDLREIERIKQSAITMLKKNNNQLKKAILQDLSKSRWISERDEEDDEVDPAAWKVWYLGIDCLGDGRAGVYVSYDDNLQFGGHSIDLETDLDGKFHHVSLNG